MAKRTCGKRELLDRWKRIREQEEDEDDPSPLKQRQIRRAKEEWFSDCFGFLENLSDEVHLWCGYPDLMGPLLETFHNYYSDKSSDSPLKLMWKRICEELGQCMQCIFHHHQAQASYDLEYESDAVGPLLKVLHQLDEERVAGHIKEINARIKCGEYDADSYSSAVVSIMFEVLTYPVLFDDQSLVNEFQIFLEAVDKHHDVTLAGTQQYPGIYALLFLKSGRARAIGYRLAGCMGKLRNAADLEPLQPLLKKYIGFLETDPVPSTISDSRPRVVLERTTIWLGVKTLLGFFEAPAYEEGVLERYPVFLSIVLNHVSGDTLDFSYAVACLRISFEILGSKLWLRTALSPSVMRNTLLGQCFHTRNEKSHKDIFDIFLPFLQSLESHQDGEHEKQRRNLLYFLLHQVTQSGNFSDLMRKNARKIALLIIHRGYKMVPPCPPFECAHMWGPSLINSLKDSTLHSSLRQPAFDLIATIIVSDASALIFLKQKACAINKNNLCFFVSSIDEDDEANIPEGIEEKDNSCWTEFSLQCKLVLSECAAWMCVPMLWHDVLLEVGPATLPTSFSKAVFWALSHVSVVELNFNSDLSLRVHDWLSVNASEISSSFQWQTPTGSDDGGEGRESRNAIRASSMPIPLIRTLKRFATEFMLQLENRELQKQWTWEPTMAESLILSLLDPDDVVRRAGKILLEHLSCECLLTSGLKFLCSSSSSLFAVLAGLRYLFRLVHVCSITDSFYSLHHAFFVTGKLLKELVRSPVLSSLNPQEYSNYGKFSSQGGFLHQPSIGDISSNPSVPILDSVDTKSWERFSCLLSQAMWPSVLKCLVEGKKCIDSMKCQMTCVRLLETLPAVYERLILSSSEESRNMLPVVPISSDFKWLSDLVDWGRSSLVVVIRHWKQCMLAILNIFKRSCGVSTESMINIIEKQISTDTVPVSNLQEKILVLAVSLAQLVSINENSQIPKQKSVAFEPSSMQKVLDADTTLCFSSGLHASVCRKEKPIEKELIVLSDDESEKVTSSEISASCCINSSLLPFHETSHLPSDKSLLSYGRSISMVGNSTFDVPEHFPSGIFIEEDDLHSSKDEKDELAFTKADNTECVFDRKRDSHVELEDPGNGLVNSSHNSNVHHNEQMFAEVISTRVTKTDMLPRKADAMVQALVPDDINDPLELACDSTSRRQPVVTKLAALAPKRKVIQLQLPANNKSSSLSRADISSRRLKPPKLDEWYRLVLEMDYFTMVGLNSINAEEKFASSLKEVPLRFESVDEYVKIFRPLVLEEFKAQLQNSFLESSVEDMRCGSLCIVSVERIDDFHIIRACPNEKESAASIGCMENDLVLLTKKPMESSVQSTHALGKVERREKSDKTFSIILVIRFYLQGSYSRLNKVKRLLIERSKWFLNRVMSITPQLREFQGLSSLSEIPMLPIILNPVGHSHGHSVMQELSKLSQPMQKMFKSSFNGSQLQAISIAIRSKASKNFELSLIQGPPGTGKTRTIVAIVSALLALRRVPNTSSTNILTESTAAINGFSNPRAQLSNSAAVARAWQDAALAKQLIKDAEKKSLCTEYSCKERVLICAQSNAAVDELVSRVNDGLCGNDGKMYTPFIVRVGNAKTVHSNSLPYFIDTLVEQRLAEEMARPSNGDAGNDSSLDCSSSLRAKLEKLVERIQYYESKRAKSKDVDVDVHPNCCDNTSKEDDMHEIPHAAIGAKLNVLYREKKLIYQNLAVAQARERKASEESKALKHKIRKSILREAEIVVTTLSGCGGDLYGVCYESASTSLSGKFFEQSLFDVVLIDEAAQALEPATLIPLQLLKSNGAKCIMVGDPKQLPATVLSRVASKFLYEFSMFERLQRAGHPVIMLTEQYRMHPEICSFPSLHFYDKKLLNGIDMESKSAKFHEHVYLGPYMFFDIADGHENHGKGSGSLSLYNEAEVEAAITIMRFLRKRYVSEFTSKKIGIITPYKSQLHLLRSRFSSVFGPSTMSDMEFNTVDGFQGREVDILVLSTVRSSAHISRSTGSSSRGIGFVADVRRMNVALTRAKFSLWIVGNAKTLQTNPHWSALVQNAKERNLFLSVLQPYESFLEQGSSFSERNSCPSSHDLLPSQVRKADTAASRCNFEQDRKNGKGDYRKKTKLLGEKTLLHPTNRSSDCEPVTSMGTQRMANDKHGKLSSGRTVSHEDAASELQKQKDKVGVSKNSLQKIRKSNKEGSKTIQNDALFDADCGLRASIDGKTNHGLSEHDVYTKPCKSIASGLLSSDKAQKGKTEKSRSSDEGVAKDLLATRKRQRDDIEALLPSALISSRKTGMLSNGAAVRKPAAATNEKFNSKPSKDK